MARIRVPGAVMAAQVTKLSSTTTVNGAPLTIQAMGGKVTVDNATVNKADIIASSGVIHVIDTVMFPK
jgi:uncharacterized surface protein with fasciclin (FAS1) repeats